MLRIGLTGGIGSGKSSVAQLLTGLGAVVTDADAVARTVMEPGEPTLAAVAARFGEGVLRPDGTLDRAGLATMVFPDPVALADLDAITGPAISERVRALRRAVPPDRVSVFDMPLLVERRLWVQEHLTLVVGADVETRVRRLVAQRGLDETDARHRIAAQATDAERREAADLWVDNGGDREATRAQVERLWQGRLAPYETHLAARAPSRPLVRGVPTTPDPTWAAQGQRFVARLVDALAAVAPEAVVDHVGPTSVSGLPAADVLDIQVGLPHLADADDPAVVAALEDRGFFRVGGVDPDLPPRGVALVDWAERLHASADPGRRAYLHVREIGSPGWQFALDLRDWLRAEPSARREYAALERGLAEIGSTTVGDGGGEERWLDAAYARVGEWAAGRL